MHEEIRKKLETKIVLLERAVKEAKEKNKASKT